MSHFLDFIELLIEIKVAVDLNTNVSTTFLCCEDLVYIKNRSETRYSAREKD